MQNPSQNLGHMIFSFAVSICCMFLFVLFHPHLSIYVSHTKDFDPYLKEIRNPLKDCEHDLMDKLKKKKKDSQWQVEDGLEGTESQRSVIVFSLISTLKWPHIHPEAHPPWPQSSVLGWTLDPRATIGSSDRVRAVVSYSLLRDADLVLGTDPQESVSKPSNDFGGRLDFRAVTLWNLN